MKVGGRGRGIREFFSFITFYDKNCAHMCALAQLIPYSVPSPSDDDVMEDGGACQLPFICICYNIANNRVIHQNLTLF